MLRLKSKEFYAISLYLKGFSRKTIRRGLKISAQRITRVIQSHVKSSNIRKGGFLDE